MTKPRGGQGDAGGCSGSAGQCKRPFECLETVTFFSDYPTDLGKGTLRESIPTNRHMFPHQFYEKYRVSAITRLPPPG